MCHALSALKGRFRAFKCIISGNSFRCRENISAPSAALSAKNAALRNPRTIKPDTALA